MNQDNTPNPIADEKVGVKEEVKEVKEEVKEEKLISDKYTNLIQLIDVMLSSNDKFVNLTNQLKLSNTQSEQIKNILAMLTNTTNGSRPIKNIVDAVSEALSDNKLEAHEIPKIINVIYDTFKKLNTKIVISSQEIGIIIKLILIILTETKVVKISDNDNKLINGVIDMSIILLNKPVEIDITKMNKCFCF